MKILQEMYKSIKAIQINKIASLWIGSQKYYAKKKNMLL